MTRLLALLALLATASAATAAGPPAEAAVPFASGYWSGFVDYWMKWIQNRNAILFTVLIAGAIGIFIITRGKKLK